MPVDLASIYQQLGIQQPQGNPSNGQATYGNGWSGFSAGITDYQNRVNSEQKGRIESQRQQLLSMIDSIPDNEQNAPMKLKLKLDIMNAKDKHPLDKVIAPHQADSIISQMYKMFSDKLPQEQGKPEMIAPQENGQYSGMNFGVSPNGPGGGQGVHIPAPVDNTGKFSFEGAGPGKWQGVNEVFQDETTGNKYLMERDATTGKTRRVDLGKAKTVKEINAEVMAKARAAARNEAVSRGYYTRAVAASKLTPSEFNALDVEDQRPYYAIAAEQLKQEQALLNEGRVATTEKNKAVAGLETARIPQVKAQTENLLAQPKDPNAITADEARTNKVLSETLDADIKRLQKIVDAPPGTYDRKSVAEAKAKLPDLIRQRNDIRGRILKPQQRLNPTTQGRGKAGIPQGSAGSVGNPNDPLGVLKP